MSQIPEHFGDAPPGWYRALESLHGTLVRMDPEYRVGEVKEEFGMLRVYLDSYESPEILNAIAIAEWRTEHTCGVCGSGSGRQVKVGGMEGRWQALCHTHELQALGVETLK